MIDRKKSQDYGGDPHSRHAALLWYDLLLIPALHLEGGINVNR